MLRICSGVSIGILCTDFECACELNMEYKNSHRQFNYTIFYTKEQLLPLGMLAVLETLKTLSTSSFTSHENGKQFENSFVMPTPASCIT